MTLEKDEPVNTKTRSVLNLSAKNKCVDMFKSLKNADWETVQKTIGNNHSTIIGVLASWFVHSFENGIVIEGAPNFSKKGRKRFKSDALFCKKDDFVVGILEVEGSRHNHTIDKIKKHFKSKSESPLLKNLKFAIYVAYSELPKGRGENRQFPEPLTDKELEKLCQCSEYNQSCIIVISLKKTFQRNRSEVRKKNDYYSGCINSVTAQLYHNGKSLGTNQWTFSQTGV